MGCLAGGRKESCASCECTAEAKRGNSLREQWELDSFVGYTAEAQHGGADKVQVWCVCVCVEDGGVTWSCVARVVHDLLLEDEKPFTAAQKSCSIFLSMLFRDKS